jgi:tetratricopeptide (TPR) repeat protein
VWAIASALDMPPESIEDACEGLCERGQFIKSAGFEEFDSATASASYEFKHSLYRQVVYSALSDVVRSRLHRSVGQRLLKLRISDRPELASELALHFERGREYDRAINYLILTSENITRKFAYRDSIQVLQHALSLVPKTSPAGRAQLEIKLLERTGDAYYALGDMIESARAFETAAVRAAGAGLKADEVNALCCFARTTVLIDGDLGIAASQRALKACEGTNYRLLLARTQLLAATLRLGYDKWRKEDAETCVSARQTIVLLSDPNSPSYHEIWDTHRQSLQGEPQEAIKTADAGISSYDEIWDTDRQSLQGEYHAALGTAEAGIAGINESSSLAAYVLALSAKAIALMHLGRFGQALEIVRTARSRAEKNGNNPWIFMLREAWLRTLVFDFEGARRLCDEIIGMNARYLSGHPNAMSAIAAGYAALYEEDYENAIGSFRKLLDRDPTPKFFLHWYWRMQSELGMSNAFLGKGDVASARGEADRFLHSALSTADPNLQALAWEMKTRVAMAERRSTESETCLRNALAVLEKFTVPVSAWKVHKTAWQLYEQRKDIEAAEIHRAQAEAGVLAIADSFSVDEPLRATYLKAAPIQNILCSGTDMEIRAISN